MTGLALPSVCCQLNAIHPSTPPKKSPKKATLVTIRLFLPMKVRITHAVSQRGRTGIDREVSFVVSTPEHDWLLRKK